MKSSPSADESSPSTVNGKKLRQARLPFKTLSGCTPPSDKIAATTEGRKRKLSESNGDDDIRAPKQNRKEVEINLLSSETLDSSIEYNAALKSKSESKENVVSIDLDDSLSDASSSEPNAKRRLNMGESSSEELITIKLPMGKKNKENGKKSKKPTKSNEDDKSVEELLPNNVKKDSDTDEDDDLDKSNVMNDSLISYDGEDVPGTPNNETMTPRQLARRAESEKKLAERQKAKQEREEQRKREREEKEQQRRKEKEEKEDQKRKEREEKEEQKRKEREEKEEQKRKEKEEKEQKRLTELEEKEKKRQAEIEAKNERKRLQEQLKEEERLKKEQEKRLKEEMEQNKNRKTAEAFVKFFVPKKNDVKPDIDNEQLDQAQSTTLFMSFEVKEGMKVAPVIRRQLEDKQRAELENNIKNQTKVKASQLYLAELKRGDRQSLSGGKTWIVEEGNVEKSDDLFILGN